MNRTRLGFIGAGGIATRHTNVLLDFPDVNIAAFADQSLDRAQELAALAGAKAYADFRQMLDCEQLDALYICVPPFAHGEIERAALERGLTFFVEKPLAADYETAAQIAREVAARNLITAVGYHWRYLDTTMRVQELLEKNPARLALGYWLDATPPPAWWSVEAQSGGQMVEQTTHIFDLTRLLIGEAVSVYAAGSRTERAEFPHTDVSDVSVATLNFASGAIGTLASTCLLRWKHRTELHLFSEAMAIELSDVSMIIDVGRGRPVEPAQGDPVVREDRDFIDAVQGKSNRIRVPYAEALRTHRLVTLAVESARNGQVINLRQAEEMND